MAPVTYELQLDFAKVLGEALFYGACIIIGVAWFASRNVAIYQQYANGRLQLFPKLVSARHSARKKSKNPEIHGACTTVESDVVAHSHLYIRPVHTTFELYETN